MASREISENATNFLGDMLTQGRPIPGQSLTNSPEQAHTWERPPELVNQREAVYEILAVITEPENLENILISIIKGVGIIDIASIMLYTGFIEGKWNPDLMVLLMEPTMYMIMAMAEKANIDYVLDSDDDDKVRELNPDEQVSKLEKEIVSLDDIRKAAATRVSPQSVEPEIRKEIEEVTLPPSLLEKVEQETPENNNSLLQRGT